MNTFLTAAGKPILEWLWAGCWQGAIVLAVIWAARQFLRPMLAPRWRHGLWFIVLIKLIVPVGPASRVSLFNLPQWTMRLLSHPDSHAVAVNVRPHAPPQEGPLTAVDTHREIALPGQTPPKGAIPSDAPPLISDPPISFPIAGAGNRPMVAALLLWLTGAMFMAGWIVYANIQFWRCVLRQASPDDARLAGILDRCRAEIWEKTFPFSGFSMKPSGDASKILFFRFHDSQQQYMIYDR